MTIKWNGFQSTPLPTHHHEHQLHGLLLKNPETGSFSRPKKMAQQRTTNVCAPKPSVAIGIGVAVKSLVDIGGLTNSKVSHPDQVEG